MHFILSPFLIFSVTSSHLIPIHCIVLHCIALHYITLHCIVLPCITFTEMYYTVSQSTKYLMLHIRDCNGTDVHGRSCQFPWYVRTHTRPQLISPWYNITLHHIPGREESSSVTHCVTQQSVCVCVRVCVCVFTQSSLSSGLCALLSSLPFFLLHHLYLYFLVSSLLPRSTLS